MESVNFLLKLLIVLSFYISLNDFVCGYEDGIYNFNINYYVDSKNITSNIETGLKMISNHSCISFTRKSNCDGRRECTKICKKKCKRFKKKCKTICTTTCKEISLPFIRFLYDKKDYTSDYYFNGTVDLMRTIVYDMKINDECTPGCVAKKVMMYLGLIPTVRRKDRNDYITLYENDIKPEYKMQYSILNDTPLYTPYDYSSIGHFSEHYGAEPYKITFLRKKLDDPFVFLTGQEIRPTFSDLKWLYHAYCEKDDLFTVTKCRNFGFPKSDGSNECECPSGYSGKFCEKLQYHSTNLCPEPYQFLIKSGGKKHLDFASIRNCTVQLKTLVGQRIRITVILGNCNSTNPCFEDNCLQIKYENDMTNTGLCLCNTTVFSTLVTATHKAIIQYIGKTIEDYALIDVYVEQ